MQDIPWFYFNLTLVNISQKYTNKQIKLYSQTKYPADATSSQIRDGLVV